MERKDFLCSMLFVSLLSSVLTTGLFAFFNGQKEPVIKEVIVSFPKDSVRITNHFSVPDVIIPEIKIPETKIPEIKIPEIKIPEIVVHENTTEIQKKVYFVVSKVFSKKSVDKSVAHDNIKIVEPPVELVGTEADNEFGELLPPPRNLLKEKQDAKE